MKRRKDEFFRERAREIGIFLENILVFEEIFVGAELFCFGLYFLNKYRILTKIRYTGGVDLIFF